MRVMEGHKGFFEVVDEIQLARAQRGDLEALERIYRLYADPVSNLARRICRTVHEAEEVVQETFLEMVRSVRSFRGDGAFGAWLRRITVSKALTIMRTGKRRAEIDNRLIGEAGLPAGVIGTAEEIGGWRKVDLERALSMLPDDARVVVWLYDVEGFTHQEIAEVFGRTASFSKSRLSRAHARLRELLNRTGGMTDASGYGRSVGAAGR